MRTREQDQGGVITFGAYMPDAAGGSGVAHPGAIPFTYTRVSAGTYAVRFDTRLTPFFVGGTTLQGSHVIAATWPGPGGVNLQAIVSTTGAPTNVSLNWTCTARDGRM